MTHTLTLENLVDLLAGKELELNDQTTIQTKLDQDEILVATMRSTLVRRNITYTDMNPAQEIIMLSGVCLGSAEQREQ